MVCEYCYCERIFSVVCFQNHLLNYRANEIRFQLHQRYYSNEYTFLEEKKMVDALEKKVSAETKISL